MTYNEKYCYIVGYLDALNLSVRIIDKTIKMQKQADINFVEPAFINMIYDDLKKYDFSNIIDVDQMIKSIDAVYVEKLNLNIPVEAVMLSIIERNNGNYERADRILIESRKIIHKGY
ncbi:MAG: hypothetical protein H0Z29_09575 [Candidatus Marinimicrobia bacterium]|nr:hypothetical protein [Candidatus Neomarinimicrobiota bacterium]